MELDIEGQGRRTGCALRRSSKAFTYPRLGPLFLRTSSYAQSWPSLVHVLHRGLFPSHLSFLFRHIIQAKRLGLGTPALFGPCGAVALVWLSSPFPSSGPSPVTMSSKPPVPFMAVSISGEDMFSGAKPSRGERDAPRMRVRSSDGEALEVL